MYFHFSLIYDVFYPKVKLVYFLILRDRKYTFHFKLWKKLKTYENSNEYFICLQSQLYTLNWIKQV